MPLDRYASLFWEDVEEGQALPGFVYDLSMLRLVSFVRATGLYDPAHHDPEFARTVGAADAFLSTAQLAGLFSRLVTDWSGPAGNLRRITFSMAAQMLRGDSMQMTGKVERKYRGEDGAFLVDLADMVVATETAPHAARATATLEMPSRGGALPAVVRQRDDIGLAAIVEDMPGFAQAMMGDVRTSKDQPCRPLTADEIHLWCEAVEDWNPLYWDEDYARHSLFGGLIAPHASTFYGAGSSADVGIGHGKPGARVPGPIAQGLKGQELATALRHNITAQGVPFVPPGCPDVVVSQAEFAFFAPHRIGETLRCELRLKACSPQRKTRLGEGYFMTVENAMFNPRDELVKTLTTILLFYRS